MTEQESKDLEETKAKVAEIKLHTWDYLRSIFRYTEMDMISSGFRNKTKGEAMQIIFNNAQEKIEKLFDTYVKKYPD